MINNKICYFNNNQDKLKARNGIVYINDSLVQQLGQGVDGEVYKYKDKAIKLYHDKISVKTHLSKKEINTLCSLSTKHIVLPKESLISKDDNPGFVMEYINLDTKKNILFANKNSLITEIKETEKELTIIGKNHFLLDDTKPENLFYNDNFYMFDPDSFVYEKIEDFSKQNLEIFVWHFIRYIVYSLNNEFSQKEHISLVRQLYYLYKKDNYSLLSNYLEDIVEQNLKGIISEHYIEKKLKTLKKI